MTPTALPPAPGEGINSPHPNDEDDPAKFFGDGEEEGGEAGHSLMPDDEGEAQEGGEEQDDEGPADDEPGGEEPAADDEKPAAEEPAAEKPAAEKPPVPASGEATAGQQLVDGDEQKEVGADGTVASSPEPAGSGEKAPPAPAASTAAKNAPRGYVVIREITLTKDYVEHFAKALEEGKEPHVIYMVLESKVESRNPAPVLTGAFKKHHKRLGQPLRLAAIPLSMWKVRSLSLKPKVIDDNIAIED